MKEKNEIPREVASVNAEGKNRREPDGMVITDNQLENVTGGFDFPFNSVKDRYAYGQDEDTGNGDYMPTPSKPTTPPNAQ